MSTITEIKQQKRDPSRYNIAVDGEYSFAMSANALLASGLHKDQELSHEELESIKQTAHGNKAYDQTLGYLSRRQRSSMEIQMYLVKKGEYDQSTIDQTIERLKQAGLVDDQAFAAAWMADRNALKPRSRRMLAQELRRKGLPPADIEQALAEVSDDREIENIKHIATKKAARYSDRQKLISYLGSLGFGYDLIKKALEPDD